MTTSALDRVPRSDPAALPKTPMPWWAWSIAAGAIFAAAVGGVVFVPEGSGVALWWPAAGLCVAFVLLQPASRLPAALAVVLVSTALANLVGGYSVGASIAFGIGNALEPAVVFAVMHHRQQDHRLKSLRAGLRFAVAVVLGAGAAAALAGLNVQLLLGGDFGSAFVIAFASNAAAVALIAPFALLPPRIRTRVSGVEMVLQAVLLLLVVALVFQPGATAPLDFVPFPYLAWAALRFPIRVVLTETLCVSLLVLMLTLGGGGPFSAPGLPATDSTGIVQGYLITMAALAVVLGTAQYELRAVWRRLQASSRLLSGSLVDAGIGLVIANDGDEHAQVIWSNPAAAALLDGELSDDSLWKGTLHDAARRARGAGEQVTVVGADGRTITVAANSIEGEDHRFAVQMVDVSNLLQARRAKLDAEAEQASARRIRSELERQRDDFLATTSHELRTPITSILGYAELLEDAEDGPEQHRAWVRIIVRNAQRLSEMVEDLLTFSRSAAKRNEPGRPERLRCSELFDEVTANLRIVAERKRLRIETDAGEAAVLACRVDTARAISNLLMNAIKFTPPAGRIRMSAAIDGRWVRLSIADTGGGMSDDEIAQAFERFYRAPDAERSNVPGVGLGLAIVAELARRNGGEVILRRNEDAGLTAELRLPVAA